MMTAGVARHRTGTGHLPECIYPFSLPCSLPRITFVIIRVARSFLSSVFVIASTVCMISTLVAAADAQRGLLGVNATLHEELRNADESALAKLAVSYQEGAVIPKAGEPLQVRLGYPRNAKLLILNADDLAVTHSEDVASFAALDRKLITSATVMVPCPWFTEVAAYAKAHPEADLGLHLTLTSEWDTYRWGPIAPRALVSSLVGPDGYFYSNTPDVVKHARLDEVETELRAQIERAKSMGLEPSHLDAHMHVLYSTPELFGVFLKVARDYKLPIRMARNDPLFASKVEQMQLQNPEGPIADAIFSPGADVPASQWTNYYVNLMKDLQPGVTEVFVHLSHDDAESQAVMVNHADWGAAWREREFQAMASPAFRKALEDNHVILIGWQGIKKLL